MTKNNFKLKAIPIEIESGLKTVATIKEFEFRRNIDWPDYFILRIDMHFPECSYKKRSRWQTPYYFRDSTFYNESIESGQHPLNLLKNIFDILNIALKRYCIVDLSQIFVPLYEKEIMRNYSGMVHDESNTNGRYYLFNLNKLVSKQIRGKKVLITVRPWPLSSGRNFHITIHPYRVPLSGFEHLRTTFFRTLSRTINLFKRGSLSQQITQITEKFD